MQRDTKLRFVLSGLLSAVFVFSAVAGEKKEKEQKKDKENKKEEKKDEPKKDALKDKGEIVFNRDIRPIFAEN